MKIHLINGWRTWHKWWSTRLKIIGLLLIAAPEAIIHAWSMIPHDIKTTIPADWVSSTGIFLVVASSFAQIIRQTSITDSEKSKYESDNHDAPKRGRGKKPAV